MLIQPKTEKPKKKLVTVESAGKRYHDMRLVFLFVGLMSFFVLNRYFFCLHFQYDFLNLSEFGRTYLSEDVLAAECWIALFELFFALVAVCFFDEEPPKEGIYNAKDLPTLTTIFIFSLMLMPIIINYAVYYIWIVYAFVMICLGIDIGRSVGFGLPMGKAQLIHLYASATSLRFNRNKKGKIIYVGKTGFVVVILFLIALLISTIYVTAKVW